MLYTRTHMTGIKWRRRVKQEELHYNTLRTSIIFGAVSPSPHIRLLPATTRNFTTVVSSLPTSQQNCSCVVAAVRILPATTRSFTDTSPPSWIPDTRHGRSTAGVHSCMREMVRRDTAVQSRDTVLYVPIRLKSVFNRSQRQLHICN
jgi:hypothetical protein